MSQRTGRTVLVVEDDADCLESIIDALHLEGYAAVGARDGREAMAYLERTGDLPCVILLDLMMPVMDGWEFVAAKNLRPDLAAIPVLLVSGEARLAEVALALGVAGCLQKPLDLDVLFPAVEQHCSAP